MSPLIDGRLPTAVVPQRYDLLLTVEPDRGEFSGSVAVHVLVREPVRAITLHALELAVPRAVVEAGGTQFPVHVSVDPDSETNRSEERRVGTAARRSWGCEQQTYNYQI